MSPASFTCLTPPVVRPLDRGPSSRFAVMLPTYKPDIRLHTALRSVLSQAPSRDAMQIAVVDDGSPPGLVQRIVRAIDPDGRVEIHENPARLGLAGNWNRALELARGRLVHLLHQDDYVLPGFYERLGAAFDRHPDLGMAFCRSRIVDGTDRPLKTSSRIQWFAGVVDGWLPQIAERQRIQTPSAIVARRTYEQIGGFRDELLQALDWEMWVRIAAGHRVWYEPRALSIYRRHAENESTRLLTNGQVWSDIARAIEINAFSLPADIRQHMVDRSTRWHIASAVRTAERMLAAGDRDLAVLTASQIPELLRLLPTGLVSERVRRRFAALAEVTAARRGRAA